MSRTQDLILGISPTDKKATPTTTLVDKSNAVYGSTQTSWKTQGEGTATNSGASGSPVQTSTPVADKGVTQPSNVTTKPPFEEWYKTVPADRNDMSSYNLRRAYELAPWDKLEAWRTSSPRDLQDGKNHLMTAYENPDTGDYEFMKSKNHPTIGKELEWYNSDDPEAVDFRKGYDLDMSGDYYRYVKRKGADSSSSSDDPTSSYTITEDELDKILKGEKVGVTGGSNVSSAGGVVGSDHYAGVYGGNNTNGSGTSDNTGGSTGTTGTNAGNTGSSNIDINMLFQDDEQVKEWQARQEAARKDFLAAVDEYASSINLEKPEEKEKREKREKRARLFAAIGDGISALANLYYTTKGAPNSYTGQDTLSDRTREKFERMKKERDADRDRWLKAQTLKVGTLDDLIKQRREDRKTRFTILQQIQKMQDDAKIAEARAKVYEQQGNLYAAQILHEQARTQTEQANALLKKAQTREAENKADVVKPVANSTINRNNTAAQENIASTNEHNARAHQIRTGKDGGSGGSGKPVGHLEGQPYYNNNDYNAAVEGRAAELGINKHVRYQNGLDDYGGPKYVTRAKTTAELAAEIERKTKKTNAGGNTGGKGRFSNFSIKKKKK